MRKAEDGRPLTWRAIDRATGAEILVDDRTFDPEQHEDRFGLGVNAPAPADEGEAPAAAKSPKKKG